MVFPESTPTTGQLLEMINRLDASMHALETSINGLTVNVRDGFRVLSHNSVMAERAARRAWNQTHPLDLKEVILEAGRRVGIFQGVI